MKKKLLKVLLCFCMVTVIMGGCSKGSEETFVREGQEVTGGIQEADASAIVGNIAEEEAGESGPEEEIAVEDTEPAVELVEPSAEDFRYNYDAAIGGIVITGYTGDAEAILIPAEIDGDPVKQVSISNEHIVQVEFPDGITEYSFIDCVSLTKIPDNITSIGYRAFSGCTGLTSVIIPDGITSIGEEAFKDCKGLTEVIIPESVTVIDVLAFWNCKSLTEITIPSGVTEISSGVFRQCSSLTRITIPDGVTEIGGLAFHECSSLTEITIPDGVTEIKIGTFEYCTSLRNLTLPDSVSSVFVGAFKACDALTITYQGQEYTYANDPNEWWG